MFKRNNPIILTLSPSLNRLSLRKKTSQTRSRYSWSSRSATSLYSPTQSVSKESGSISNKFISIGLNEIVSTSFTTIVTESKQLFQVLDSVTNSPQFISKYTEVLPLNLREILLKQMSMVLAALSKPTPLPLICSFLIDGKLCFHTYPIVLSALCVESFSDLPARVLPESIKHASIILKEFSLLIELLDKDIEQFMTVMGSILTYERVDLRMSHKRSELENSLMLDQWVFNTIAKGDIQLQEMRKYSKELYCVSNSLGTIHTDLNESKGIIIRHGSLLLKQTDKFNEKLMSKAVLILYPTGLQIYIIPLHDCIIESIWISIDNLIIGNITGEDGELWVSGWCVLTFQNKATNKSYCVCSNNLLTTLLWHDDMLKCIKMNTSNNEIPVNIQLSDCLPTTIFGVTKELIFRGCSSVKNYFKLKTKGTLKKIVQNNPNIDLATVPIDEITEFFINYFKNIKPKLLNKNDIELFNRIDFTQNEFELTGLNDFFESKDEVSRSVLLSFLFLITCFINNGNDENFTDEDGMKILQIVCDSSFKKKCFDSQRIKFIFDCIGDIISYYSLNNTPMTLIKISLMKEPIRKLYLLHSQKVVVLFQRSMFMKNGDQLNTVTLPHDYFSSCCSGDYVLILNKNNLTRINGMEIKTIEVKDSITMTGFKGVLLIVFKTKIEFIDIASFTIISTVNICGVDTVKTTKTKVGFVVIINNKHICFYDTKGSLLKERIVEYMNKEITFIVAKDELIFIGFNDGSISVLNETNGNELEIIVSFEGTIKDIVVGIQHVYALTSNNTILVIDKFNYQILSIFTPLSMATSLLVCEDQTLLIGTTNSILQYHLNSPSSCTSIKLTPFFVDIPESMSTLNHSLIPNIFHIQANCLICHKPLTPHDLICRYCQITIHGSCLSSLSKDCKKR
ncbi:hypothetical protein ENU1_088570 [Entamoeba nuttalli P19]|uniref:Phorbol-ester/DAG-type domain-containing protein n=1 Tax=Entamoeba nuttalli (strain P19) TaxID=1076696 RepID=K2H2G1_ENTNP|nr:hypothetical protein ENU1_088570 [Entamoeba nuttalli P19]EKE40507.1 hypothetical protein ENU1_088570 [Entamoeba nuttalli P19]|eukprot:XP_008857165.1 hypothetical protein ENU1_088570 [Entamoeba nuttalli P19]